MYTYTCGAYTDMYICSAIYFRSAYMGRSANYKKRIHNIKSLASQKLRYYVTLMIYSIYYILYNHNIGVCVCLCLLCYVCQWL